LATEAVAGRLLEQAKTYEFSMLFFESDPEGIPFDSPSTSLGIAQSKWFGRLTPSSIPKKTLSQS